MRAGRDDSQPSFSVTIVMSGPRRRHGRRPRGCRSATWPELLFTEETHVWLFILSRRSY